MEDEIDLKGTLKSIELDCILNALKSCTPIKGAADKLGMKRTTLSMRLRTLGINGNDYLKCMCNCHRKTEERKVVKSLKELARG